MDVRQLTCTDFGILTSHCTHINNIRVNVREQASSGLRSNEPHVRSVHINDTIRQCHLRDGFLIVQGTSTFASLNPECPIRSDKVTNHLRYAGFRTG